PVAAPSATAGAPGQGSWHGRRGREKYGCADTRSGDTAPTTLSSARPRAHPSSPCGCDTSTLIALPRTACRPAAPRDQAPGHTPLAAGEPARSPLFCGDFLHHLNLKIALRHELLQSRILRLELPQALNVVRLQSTETLAPSIDRLLADAVPLGDGCHRIAIPLPDDRDHLLFRKTCFPHCSLRIGSQSLNSRWSENPGAGQPLRALSRILTLTHAPSEQRS